MTTEERDLLIDAFRLISGCLDEASDVMQKIEDKVGGFVSQEYGVCSAFTLSLHSDDFFEASRALENEEN